STPTVTFSPTLTATSGSNACSGIAVWQNNATLYNVGTLAVDPASNGEYKALVTCWGYNGEPSTSPSIWSYVGPCGSMSNNIPTFTYTFTRTVTPAATVTSTATCGTNYPVSASVPLTLQGQQESEWCWAACSSMEMSFFGVNITQCSQATAEYGTNCCVANQCDYYADGVVCNPYAGGVVDIGSYGFNALGSCEGGFPNTGTTLTFAQIQDQIYCQKKPYIFAWNWDGGGGHVLVVVGYTTDPVQGQMVEVDDPLPDCQGANRFMTYGDYVGETNGVYYTSDPDGGAHSHQCDIYDVTYSGGN
ncbi:MAG TPA: hypothetical protein VK791_06515, partial [bacterium]|nr:hypothetical protein [bacterium]